MTDEIFYYCPYHGPFPVTFQKCPDCTQVDGQVIPYGYYCMKHNRPIPDGKTECPWCAEEFRATDFVSGEIKNNSLSPRSTSFSTDYSDVKLDSEDADIVQQSNANFLVCPIHGSFDVSLGECPWCSYPNHKLQPSEPIKEEMSRDTICPKHGPYLKSLEQCPLCALKNTGKPLERDYRKSPKSESDPPPSPKKHKKSGLLLRETFRYIHEPLSFLEEDNPVPFIGREVLHERFITRLEFSLGGAFLITGFRGSGKTTFVNLSLARLRKKLEGKSSDKRQILVDIRVNLAREISPMAMMHIIIRRMYHRLEDLGLLNHLEPELRRDLRLAYQRTSFTIAQKQSQSSAFGLSTGIQFPFLPEMKASREMAIDSTYLSYDENAAETDLIELGQRLVSKSLRPKRKLFRRSRSISPRLKIIFVFDELDKVEGQEKERAFWEILNSLKNVFSTSGITFIFVAGLPMHQKWLDEISRGDSVLESVFAEEIYLPLLWSASSKISDWVLSDVTRPMEKVNEVDIDTYNEFSEKALYEKFQSYLHYKGRGLPRLIFRNLNAFVRIQNDLPYLALDPEDYPRLTIFSQIDKMLIDTFPELTVNRFNAERDQYCLSIYYLCDWIFEQRHRSFALEDIYQTLVSLNHSMATSRIYKTGLIIRLINVLKEQNIIEEVVERPEDTIHTQLKKTGRQFRLVPQVAVRVSEPQGAKDDTVAVDEYIERVRADISGDFWINNSLKVSGNSWTFAGTDAHTGKSVIIKCLTDDNKDTPYFRDLIINEARILQRLTMEGNKDFGNLVQASTGEARPYIVTEKIPGPTLTSITKKRGPLAVNEAITLMLAMAKTLSLIHSFGIVHGDIKPDNIILRTNGIPILIDFGIALFKNEGKTEVAEGAVIGTPTYISPEQAKGYAPDERSDIYSLGTTIYRMVTGQPPFQTSSVQDMLYSHIHLPIQRPSRFRPNLPEAFEDVLMKCLEKHPEDRFFSSKDLVKNLHQLEEFIDNRALVRLSKIESKSFEGSDEDDEVTDMGHRGLDNEESLQEDVPRMIHTIDSESQSSASPVIEVDGYDIPMPDAVEHPHIDSLDVIPLDLNTTHLVITEGINIGASFPLGHETKIGRVLDMDIVLGEDAMASRVHASIVKHSDGMHYIEDLNTSNGTYVNNTRIHGLTRLYNNDLIRIGSTEFRYVEVSQP